MYVFFTDDLPTEVTVLVGSKILSTMKGTMQVLSKQHGGVM